MPVRSLVALFVVLSVAPAAVAQEAEPATRVFLNGVPTPVYFNDGDSFRVLEGPLAGTRARLAGFNTLESYGAVHQWGNWTAHELYVNAKMGTLHARRGMWHCDGDPDDKDGYGRILWHCKDLGISLCKNGFAHAMTIDAEPADPDFIAAQQEAIAARRGMWAHGVPAYVLTSLHSAAEGGGRDGRTYNRMVSTKDGHSEMWLHNDNYTECDKVCQISKPLSPETRATLVAAVREGLPAKFEKLDDLELGRRIQNVIDFGQVGWMLEDDGWVKDDAVDLTEHISDVLDDATWTPVEEIQGPCMVHVDFKRRYGGARASCLKK